MDPIVTCPTDEALKLLLDDALPESESQRVQQHLEQCEKCQATIQSLAAGQESWEAARNLGGIAAGRNGGKASPNPTLEKLMYEAKQNDEITQWKGSTMRADSATIDQFLEFLKPSDRPDSRGRLGNYEVLDVLGRGGFGIVLKAFDPSLHRIVAIKLLAPHLASSGTGKMRFVREARAAAAVSHDHVVSIHAVEESHNPPYIVMQYVAGKTLQDRLNASGTLNLREILRIAMQTASGLAAAHEQGLVHRDIKPTNILLENGVERVKITDFGLARATDDVAMTQTGVVAGTPQFMAPEQANGETIDARSDLFSLGSVMYTMCTGRPPFRASTTMGVLKRVCEETPAPVHEANDELPEWLQRVVAKLMAKRPEDRFQTASEVVELLSQCLSHVHNPKLYALPPAVTSLATKSQDPASATTPADINPTRGTASAASPSPTTGTAAVGISANPSNTPDRATEDPNVTGAIEGLWRDGSSLVMHRRARAPNRCVKTNRPTAARINVKGFWYPPLVWIALLIGPMGLVIMIILTRILGKHYDLAFGMVEDRIAALRRWKIIMYSLVSIGIVVFGAALAIVFVQVHTSQSLTPYLIQMSVGVALMALGVFISFFLGTVSVRKVDGEYLWISGCHRDYLAGLAPWKQD